MVRGVRLASAAKDDLENIRRYTIREWGVDQADKYLAALRQKFAVLADHPGIAPKLFERSAYRAATYREHRILYRVKDDAIEIARVLHHAHDITRAIDRVQQRHSRRERTASHEKGREPDEPEP